ncbi:hypothetical protein AN642_01965 [Epulopiscium sp. SCG-B10WGA-EpuloA2]|nr:hypothetical protein AN642_01965 [Epulopiscium sp. SCG-B10WGA-EpuloA2]
MAIALCSVAAIMSTNSSVMAASNAIIDTKDMIIGSTLGYKIVDGEVTKDGYNIFVNTTIPYTNEQFLIQGHDVVFNADLYNENIKSEGTDETVNVKYLDSNSIRVAVSNISSDNMFMVPLFLEVTGENPSVEIIGNGGISSQMINLSQEVVSDKNIKIKFGEKRNVPIEGEGFLGEIIIDEVVPGALKKPATVTLDLETNSGVVFDIEKGQQVNLVGKAGFAGTKTVGIVTELTANDQQITIEFPSLDDHELKGGISIVDIPVKPENRKVGVICDEILFKKWEYS